MGWGYIDEEPTWQPPTSLPNLKGETRIAIDTETYDPHLLDRGAGNVFDDGCIIGISMAVSPTDKWYCPIKSPFNDGFAIEEIREWADRTFNDATIAIGANLMYDIGWLDYHGVTIKGKTYDVQWVEALINEHKNSYSLDNIALDYGLGGKDSEDLYIWCAEKFGGKADGRQRKHMHEAPLHLVGPYAEADAALPLQIAELQKPQIEADGLEQVVDLEHRLMPMLLAMRKRGVRVNMAGRQALADYLDTTLIDATTTVRRVAGREVNVNAAADIAKVFDSNNWDYPLTAKAQKPSFTKGFLTTCDHEFGAAIAAVRRLGKMKTTFVDGYFGLAYKGRLHSNLHPLRTGENGTVSGRLSCVPAHTPISMGGGGSKPMSSIKQGDEVITHTGEARKVLDKWFTSVDDVYRMCLCDGSVLECTSNHRILTCEGWQTLGEIHERFKNSVGRCPALPEDSLLLHGRRQAFYREGRRKDAGDIPEHTVCAGKRSASRCVQKGEGSEVRTKQSGRVEPDDRKIWEPTPHVQGCGRRWERLSDGKHPQMDDQSSLESSIPSCGGAPEGVEANRAARWVPCTPHKPREDGQPTIQLGTRVCGCSSCNTLDASHIRSIEYVGAVPVFDMEVETDHSFVAGGVIVHNCSHPNIQNIPSNDKEFAPLIRGLFLPEEGERWVCLDFSQIEYRLLAHYALGKGADTVRQQYSNDPETDFHKLVQDATGMGRKAAKCIAEGQLVLTDKGLVPIQEVTCCHRVWDGVEWVSHKGVTYMGIKEVITYDGLTATPDHEVWSNEGRKIDLGMGKATHARLIHSGRGTDAIKLRGIALDTAYDLPRERQARKTGAKDTGRMHHMRETPHSVCFKHQGEEDAKLQVPAGQVQRSTCEDTRGQISGHSPTVSQGHTCEFDELSRERDKVSVREQHSLHKMGAGNLPRGDIQGEGIRQDRQQRALRRGQSAPCDTERESSEQTQYSNGRKQRGKTHRSDMGIPLLRGKNNHPCIKGHERRGDDTASEGNGTQEDEGLASSTGETKTARVYDIVNAGPRNRFTVSGVLVKNCLNFGMVYGQGIDLTAESLGVDRETAIQFRNEYYARAPYVKATSDAVMNRAQHRGWIKTIMGRRARFTSWEPASFDLSKELGNFPTREEALKVTARHLDVDIACTQIVKRARTYKALNALLQGSAADLMKKAMVDVWESGVCDVLGAPLLTVHDELDWSKPQTKEGDEAIAHASRLMCDALPAIKVPVMVDCEEGADWGHIS